MKKNILTILALAAAFVSCQEWEPVGTCKYKDGAVYEPVEMTPTLTIAELKDMYKTEGSPVQLSGNLLIGGQVVSEDRSGNIYRSFYIQDESGAIEVKIGKTSLYNDYKPGQWVYIDCDGLYLGKYEGMLQLGIKKDDGSKYETSYLDVQYFIDQHIFRGKIEAVPEPVVVPEGELTLAKHQGCLVTLKGLRYGCNPDRYSPATKKIFCLVYVDSNFDTTLGSNRIFLSDETYGVTTWAMSKEGFKNYLAGGNFDSAQTNGNVGMTGYWNEDDQRRGITLKDRLMRNASAYSVSQYFLMGGTDVQIRTSGYAKFADTQMDPSIIDGSATIDVTGILTIYQGSPQFVLIDLGGVKINK